MQDTELAVTLDIDWAPDFAIHFVADLLLEHQVRATWFITHRSAAIERLRQHPAMFELGIHPNFLPGSTHGCTTEEVLRHCLETVPEARSMRTHGLHQSTYILQSVLDNTEIGTDVSLFLPRTTYLQPVKHSLGGRSLLRIPYFWDDSYERLQQDACWDLAELISSGKGLKVLNFHPIHIFLNSSTMEPYQSLRQKVPNIREAELSVAERFIQQGDGTQTLFRQLIEFLNAKRSWNMRDLKERWPQGY